MMRIFSWNINGIRAVEKKGLLSDFVRLNSPDIICLQETKIQDIQVNDEGFKDKYENYNQIYSFAQRKGYSGTAIWLKNNINVYQKLNNFPEEILNKFKLKDKFGDASSEGRICAVELADFWLISVYTPNSKGDLSRIPLRQKWDAAFLEFCQYLESGRISKAKKVIFCGDINVAHEEIDLANPKQNKGKHGFTAEERLGFSNIINSGYTDIFRMQNPNATDKYTWWSYYAKSRERNVGWRIDYFVVSGNIDIGKYDAKIHPEILGSDHCPISLEIKD